MKIDKSKSAATKSAAGKAKGSKAKPASKQAGADFAAELARLQGSSGFEAAAETSDRTGGVSDPLSTVGGVGGEADMSGVLALQEVGTSAPVQAPAKVGQVQAVEKVEAVGDALDGRRRAQVRARALIESLEEIRMGLLLGAIPLDQMLELAKMAITAQDDIDDPALIKLLQDIELRSLIEIAKYAPELLDDQIIQEPAEQPETNVQEVAKSSVPSPDENA